MSRRRFLQTTVAGAVAAGGSACAPQARAGKQDALANASHFELSEWTIADLQAAMHSGALSARALTEMYLSRIATLDRSGPALHSIIETNPDALPLAGDLDRERQTSGARGPLHGIPVLLKDNMGTADAMTTTAGSLALEGCIAPRDATVVQRLRQAGAVLLGKTNMSEWANFRSLRSTSGWSGRGGLCKNPYALDRNAGGSSSGSGAATSANFGAVALGTETDGSIVVPAHANGIVGLKPTVGLVSRSGIIPVAHSQDTAGPMTRTVTDAAILLGIIAGVDSRDAATREAKAHAHTDYTRFLDARGLAGARIGVARKYFGFHPAVDRRIEEAIEIMRREGAEIIDPVTLSSRSELAAAELQVLLFEFKDDLERYLAELGDAAPHRSLAEIIAFNDNNEATEMRYFGQEIFLAALAFDPSAGDAYKQALATSYRLSRNEGIDRAVREHRLDALVAPTGAPAWTSDLINGDHNTGGCSTLAAAAGYPHITVPAGYIHGLPVGISFFAAAWSEPTLLKLAYAFEQATRFRREPGFDATLVP